MPMKHVEKHMCLCKPECMSIVHAKQRYMHTVHVNHDAHGSRLMCNVYTHALNVHFYVLNLLCTWKSCCKHF